jgi:hypothetical protein
MLDGKAYKALLQEDADTDLVPRLRDPALLEAFAALKPHLRAVLAEIAGQRPEWRNWNSSKRHGFSGVTALRRSRPFEHCRHRIGPLLMTALLELVQKPPHPRLVVNARIMNWRRKSGCAGRRSRIGWWPATRFVGSSSSTSLLPHRGTIASMRGELENHAAYYHGKPKHGRKKRTDLREWDCKFRPPSDWRLICRC